MRRETQEFFSIVFFSAWQYMLHHAQCYTMWRAKKNEIKWKYPLRSARRVVQ